MKKLLALGIVLLMITTIFGQSVKVTPTFKKGMVKTYTNMTAITTMDQTVHINSEQHFSITKETSQGYELSMETTNFSSDAKEDHLASRLVTIGAEILKDTKILLSLNKDGNILDIINYQEVKDKSLGMVNRLVDELFKVVPDLSNMLKKETVVEQVSTTLTKENLINSLTGNTCPLALFGRTIFNGMQDQYNNNLLDLKRTWLVNGKKIYASAKADMSKEEMKAFLISQIEKIAPQQAEMVKENIDMVLSSGLVKIDVTEKTNFELADDYWVKSMENVLENEMMGQKSKTLVKIQLKD